MTAIEWIQVAVSPLKSAIAMYQAGELGDPELRCVIVGVCAGLESPPPGVDPGLAAAMARVSLRVQQGLASDGSISNAFGELREALRIDQGEA